jgi:uncharacterized protein (TIGR03437 family)
MRSDEDAVIEAIIRTPAGSGFYGFSGDNGPATNARFSSPNGVAIDASGSLYIADLYNDRIRKVGTDGVITTFAGKFGGTFAGDGGPAIEAGLFDPAGVAVDEKGNVYIADMDNNRVRKVDTTGKITTVAGNGNFGYTGDNVAATQTALSSPTAVAVDATGNLYIADLFNSRIRKVNAQGIITTFAGTGVDGYGGDNGPAIQARIDTPESVAVDRAGNVYIADSASAVVRRVDTAGVITTFAGTGVDGYSGDGGQARLARLSSPRGVVAEAAGNIYVADAGNDRIRQVDPSGMITTVAGNGQTGYNGDGIRASQASLFEPVGLTADAHGVVYIADSYNDRIRMLKSAQLQFFGLSRYVVTTGDTQTTIGLIGTGLEDSLVTINGQNAVASLDAATGNLAVMVPPGLLAAPGVLSFQVSRQQMPTPAERKAVVAALAQLNPNTSVTVSAASYQVDTAAESIDAMFGTRLAVQIASAGSIPLPTSLAGTMIVVNGIMAPLFFVSPGQINYQMPQELPPGSVVTIVTVAGDGIVSQGQSRVLAEAPGIFTANTSGSGAPAALWTLDGNTYSSVTNPDGTLRAIPAGAYLVLFVTGIRHAPDPNPTDGNGVAESVQVNLGGVSAAPFFAGAQGGFVGLDQINLQIPASLAGRGDVEVVITVNGRAANTIQLRVI